MATAVRAAPDPGFHALLGPPPPRDPGRGARELAATSVETPAGPGAVTGRVPVGRPSLRRVRTLRTTWPRRARSAGGPGPAASSSSTRRWALAATRWRRPDGPVRLVDEVGDAASSAWRRRAARTLHDAAGLGCVVGPVPATEGRAQSVGPPRGCRRSVRRAGCSRTPEPVIVARRRPGGRAARRNALVRRLLAAVDLQVAAGPPGTGAARVHEPWTGGPFGERPAPCSPTRRRRRGAAERARPPRRRRPPRWLEVVTPARSSPTTCWSPRPGCARRLGHRAARPGGGPVAGRVTMAASWLGMPRSPTRVTRPSSRSTGSTGSSPTSRVRRRLGARISGPPTPSLPGPRW